VLPARQREWHLQRVQQPLRDRDDLLAIAEAVAHDAELVAAEARERIAGAHDRRETHRELCSSSSPAPWPRLSLMNLK